MQYRALGATGVTVSELGLGCEGFAGWDEALADRIMGRALDAGVRCMDLYSPDPELRSRVGHALRGRMDGFSVQGHLCTVWKNGQYEATRDPQEVAASFEDLLRRLGTERVEIGMIHYVDSAGTWKQVLEGGAMDYALRQKEAGRIGHIGISSHNPGTALEAVRSGLVEVLMFSVNPCYDLLPGGEDCEDLWADASYENPLLNMDPEREALYEECQRRGVGITVMKAFGGGDLLTDESPAGKPLTAFQCLNYALTRPAVSAVMAGAHSAEELEACLAYEDAPAEERDYAAALAAFPRISWKGHCMYCGHCAPCPKGIDVASVTKFLSLCRNGETPETAREHYKALAHHASECVKCGACEKRCPFGVAVRENMEKAREVFGL